MTRGFHPRTMGWASWRVQFAFRRLFRALGVDLLLKSIVRKMRDISDS